MPDPHQKQVIGTHLPNSCNARIRYFQIQIGVISW